MNNAYEFVVVVEPDDTPHWSWVASLYDADGNMVLQGAGDTDHDALAALVRMHWSEARDVLAALDEGRAASHGIVGG